MKKDTKRKIELMGRIVTISAVYERKHETRKLDESGMIGRKGEHQYRFWERKEIKKRSGWVVGFRTLQGGFYEGGGKHWDYESSMYDDYDPPSVSVEETFSCVLIAFWPSMKPVKVPLDSFLIGGEPRTSEGGWTPEAKEEMKEIMKDHPRDSKGRWLKILVTEGKQNV